MNLEANRAAPFTAQRAAEWIRLIGGLAVVFGLFHWTASALGSDYGQAGLLVALIVVTATVGLERLTSGRSVRQAMTWLGLGAPSRRGVLAAVAVSVLLLAIIPVYGAARSISFAMYPGWGWLVPGLFAQAGIAEETLFRGYLFRHVRQGRTFWRAGLIAGGPFVLVHLLLFVNMPWPVATAAVLLSWAMSFPLAYLFEMGGRTIWAPALLHFVVQGAIKIVVPASPDPLFPLVWMVASAVVPFLVFLGDHREP